MSKKIIRIAPDQLECKDRGKMKWKGLMLSQHLDLLREIDASEKWDLQSAKKK